ncbi:hypothetical protein IAT38_005149 [Cryptococcus sp. DSM 104549]
MFGVSLQDRLKAAVNTLEATGTSLQARALHANQQTQGSPKDGSRPVSPNTAKSPPASSSATLGVTSPSTEKSSTLETSPTRSTAAGASAGGAGAYAASTSQLAENALSGLRKSFHFGNRSSTDIARPVNTSVPSTPGVQELKDITSPTAANDGGSRSGSPNPKLLRAASFSLGSDSSMGATPVPRSPSQIPASKLRSATPLPPQDPNNPATIPLPPSPVLSPTPIETSKLATPLPSAGFADPLGASPLLDAKEGEGQPPALGLQEPSDEEKSGAGEGVGLGMKGIEVDTPGSVEEEKGASAEKSPGGQENGKVPELESSRLADAERRYEDLSKRFTALLTSTHNANKVLKDLTPLEGGVADHEALEGWVRMMNGKVEMITAEMKRLQDKVTLQDSRMEEVRDTHRLEAASQQELITKLRSDLSDAQSKATSATLDQSTATQLRADLVKAQTQAKEEEEKRTKAISLLKTVRLKLVKVEKEREEIEKDRAEERAERSRAGEEVERVKADREREVNNLRKGFERELAGAKERHEKDLQAKKAAWELEMITTKAAHAKDISAKSTKVNGLEAIVKELNVNKQQIHEVLQAKQAEAESARTEMEAMQTRTKELEFQLREANERCALLEDSVREQGSGRGRAGLGLGVPDGQGSASRSPSRSASFSGAPSSSEVQRLLAEAEARSEAKVSDLRFKIRSLETERNELEEEWAAKVQERVRELEKMRRQVQEKDIEFAESLRSLKERESKIEEGENRVKSLERELTKMKTKVEEVKGDGVVAAEAERAAREEISSFQIQLSTLQTQLEESKSHVAHLKSTNKTLRDEMRKVQSSVQLMERQRNPGVGYWSSGAGGATPGPSRSGVQSPVQGGGMESPGPGERRKSLESVRTAGTVGTATGVGAGTGTGVSSPAPSEKAQDEEEVNLEYLRNVILQFLEHKEMRPNLVRVLSVILRFTPQELRRLNAKLLT